MSVAIFDERCSITIHESSGRSLIFGPLNGGAPSQRDRFPIEMSTFRVYGYESTTIIVEHGAASLETTLGAGSADDV